MSRSRRPGAAHHDHHDEHHDVADVPHLWALVLKRVQSLNRLSVGDWSDDEYPELEALIMDLLAAAEALGEKEHKGDPFGKEQLLNGIKRQARALLQSLQPPDGLEEALVALWNTLALTDVHAQSSFARQSIMNAKVRADVMNRQMVEAVEEADRLAAERRVEAIGREHDGSHAGDDRQEQQQDATPEGAAAAESSAAPPRTLKQALKQLKQRRRTIAKDDAEQVAKLALDALRALRDEVAPRWAPETQPWLIQTADTHVYQSVLAVLPEELFKDTAAFEGIQRLRAGEHAFALRAAEKLGEALARGR